MLYTIGFRYQLMTKCQWAKVYWRRQSEDSQDAGKRTILPKLFPKSKFRWQQKTEKPKHKKAELENMTLNSYRQKELGNSVKAFETGANFSYIHLLHFKTNSCFQLHALQWLTYTSLRELCLLRDWRREENHEGWLRLTYYNLCYLFSCHAIAWEY